MIRKHSTTLHGHRTSFSLEDEFWSELNAIAATRAIPLAALISEIDDQRDPDSNLSSALRVHVIRSLKGGLGSLKGGPCAVEAGLASPTTELSHDQDGEQSDGRAG
jgi:predicted DNA-binding ribbon-helix-helix protein